MLTALDCYLLWSLFWIQFVVALGTFSYRGQNLSYYTTHPPPFDRSAPDLFLFVSITLSGWMWS